VRGVRGWRWLAALAALAIAVAGVVLLRSADPEDESNQQGVGIREGGTVRFATTDEPSGFNPNTSKDDSTAVRNIVVTMYPSVFRVHPDFSVRLDPSFMTGAELTSHDPQTITYRIRQDACWSDGQPITADDFQYLWEHLNGKNPKIDVASTTGYDRIKQVTGSTDGKTVTVVFNQRFADWQRLLPTCSRPTTWAGSQAAGTAASTTTPRTSPRGGRSRSPGSPEARPSPCGATTTTGVPGPT
jgi:peptide/nickel transport system substrate-binding protein